MQDLTFGEQVKIILGRKGMTIKQLAELIEEKTGKKMSRQNLTQRLGRDNFQEQDMRMIAEMLECPFYLSIMSAEGTGEFRSAAAPEHAAVRAEEAETPNSEEVSLEANEPEEILSEANAAEEIFAEVNEPKAALPEANEPKEVLPEGNEAEEILPETNETEAVLSEERMPEEVLNISPEEAEESEEIPAAAYPMTETFGMEENMTAETESNDRDMTIGELYEIHEELNELEKNVKAGEPIEEIKKELEKPKKERRLGSFFRRRDPETKSGRGISDQENEGRTADIGESAVQEEESQVQTEQAELQQMNPEENGQNLNSIEQEEQVSVSEASVSASEKKEDFEPVLTHNDADEDTEAGDVNPYTGREYQSNSVRMHPTRIGYVQVYDRTIHKWTDMTEWAFLGLQERKKALLGKAYEPPIYLD